MIEQVIGHYRLLGLLGRGGMASVYLAEQVGLRRKVALKMLHPALAADDVVVQRFLREARIAANLHHPHIVSIYDIGEHQGANYIAMRYIQGESLAQLLRREAPLEVTRALSMLEQIADVLDFAHGHGVLHRDVKPANVMVEAGDFLTLTDFGIARAGEKSNLTSARMVIGTPQYMSPEQAQGAPVDKRSDLYALGVMLYEMLGGQLPFSADSTPSLLFMHVHEPPPPLSTIRPDLPPALNAVVSRALAKDPDARFQSGHEMVVAVRAALAGSSPPHDEMATSVFTPETQAWMPGTAPAAPPSPVPTRPQPDEISPVQSSAASAGRAGTAPQTPSPLGSRSTSDWPHDAPAIPVGSAMPSAQTQPPSYPAYQTPAAGYISLPGGTPGERQYQEQRPILVNAWLIGLGLVAIIALVLLAGVLVLQQAGVLERITAAPARTAVAVPPTPAPLPATAPPTEAPTPAPTAIPTVAPTAGPTPTVPPIPTQPPATQPPATLAPVDRLAAAQLAVTAGDLPGGIQRMEALRREPDVVANPKLLAAVEAALLKAHIQYGDQLLDGNLLDESYQQYALARSLAPDDPDAISGQNRVTLTRNYQAMEANWGKDDEAAIRALEENMAIDSGFRDTREKLFALLIAKADRLTAAGNKDEAYRVLIRAQNVIPGRPETRQRLAPYTPTPVPGSGPDQRPPGEFRPSGRPV